MQQDVKLNLPTDGSPLGSFRDLVKYGLEEEAILQAKQDAAIPSIIDDIKKTIPEYEASTKKKPKAITDAEKAVTTAGNNVTKAVKKLTSAQAAVDKALAAKETKDKPGRVAAAQERLADAQEALQKAQQSFEQAQKVLEELTAQQESQQVQKQAKDSEGATLTEQQAEYFADSKVRDEDGNLLRVYHGTSEEFTVFDRTRARTNMDIQGSFFSPWEIDASGYGENVKAYYLNITNPAPEGVAYKALNKFKGQNGAGIKAREYLESLGYDGVNNGNEEYIAFNPEQIKLVENKRPTTDPDIRYARKETESLQSDNSVIQSEYAEIERRLNNDGRALETTENFRRRVTKKGYRNLTRGEISIGYNAHERPGSVPRMVGRGFSKYGAEYAYYSEAEINCNGITEKIDPKAAYTFGVTKPIIMISKNASGLTQIIVHHELHHYYKNDVAMAIFDEVLDNNIIKNDAYWDAFDAVAEAYIKDVANGTAAEMLLNEELKAIIVGLMQHPTSAAIRLTPFIKDIDVVQKAWKDFLKTKEVQNPKSTHVDSRRKSEHRDTVFQRKDTDDAVAMEYGYDSADDLFKAAEDNFGTTTDYNYGKYLLPDGKFLDFKYSEEKSGMDVDTWEEEYGWAGDDMDHDFIDLFIEDMEIGDFIQLGAIRTYADQRRGVVQMRANTAPSAAQLQSIRKQAEYVLRSGTEYIVAYVGEDGEQSETYHAGDSPDTVLNNIRYFFANGHTRSSSVSQFHTQYQLKDTADTDLDVLNGGVFADAVQGATERRAFGDFKAQIERMEDAKAGYADALNALNGSRRYSAVELRKIFKAYTEEFGFRGNSSTDNAVDKRQL